MLFSGVALTALVETFKPSVLVVGLGCVGSLLVHALNEAGVTPTVVVRSGVRSTKLRTPRREPVEIACALASWAEVLGEWDYVLVATKAYDALEVIERLGGVRFRRAVFVQNGLGVLERAERLLGEGRVAQLVLNHGVYYDEGRGEFVWVGGTGSYLGARGHPGPELRELAGYLRALDVVVVDDVEPYRWLKLAVNASINSITAVLGVPNGYLVKIPELADLARRVAREVQELAKRAGVVMPADPADEVLRVAERTADNISSTLADLRRCRRTEVDFINGAVVELGRRLGVSTPYNEALYALVKSLEAVCGSVRG